MKEISVSRSRALGSTVVYEALKVLSENGGEMRGKDVIAAVKNRVVLDDWATEQYEKTGYIRWRSMLHFFSIDCIKAGFLVKKKGVWFITPDVRQLMGLLQKDGDVGIFFSTGGFTPDAKSTARSSHVHVELIDLDRFIVLWQEFYEKMIDEDKARLPLRPVYFIAPQN